jgi:ssDNA thymidine ADP-ribosyltransferase, DarT
VSTFPVPTFIYHITHLDNLAGIIRAGGIYSKHKLDRGYHKVDVSHYDVQERRAKCLVPCGNFGTLHNYIPFYFAPRSPMLFALHRNNVAKYEGGQTPMIYLVSSVQRVLKEQLGFVFTNGHPIMKTSRFYQDVSELEQVRWDVMESRYWNDTLEFPNRKQVRQAEFLVHDFFPWECVQFLAVRLNTTKNDVQLVLTYTSERVFNKPIQVKNEWYF